MSRTAYGLSTPRDDMHWSQLAPCAKADPEVLFPHPQAVKAVAAARKVCAPCPYGIECLTDGIARKEWESVRAGHTGPERAKFHRAGLTPDLYPRPGQPYAPKAWQQPRPCVTCQTEFIPGRYRSTALNCVPCQPNRSRKEGPCTRCGKVRLIHARQLCEACYSTLRRANLVPARKRRPHGTEAAYERHRVRGEQPCEKCREFMRVLWSARGKGARRNSGGSGAQLADALGRQPVEVPHGA